MGIGKAGGCRQGESDSRLATHVAALYTQSIHCSYSLLATPACPQASRATSACPQAGRAPCPLASVSCNLSVPGGAPRPADCRPSVSRPTTRCNTGRTRDLGQQSHPSPRRPSVARGLGRARRALVARGLGRARRASVARGLGRPLRASVARGFGRPLRASVARGRLLRAGQDWVGPVEAPDAEDEHSCAAWMVGCCHCGFMRACVRALFRACVRACECARAARAWRALSSLTRGRTVRGMRVRADARAPRTQERACHSDWKRERHSRKIAAYHSEPTRERAKSGQSGVASGGWRRG